MPTLQDMPTASPMPGASKSASPRPVPTGQMLVVAMRRALEEFRDEPPTVLADWIAGVVDDLRPSAVQLLSDRGTSLDSLRQAKDLYKLMRVMGESSASRRLGHRLYAASIAAALVHYDARISDQSDSALSRALHFLKDDEELPGSIRDMVRRATVRLPHVPPSRVRVDAVGQLEAIGTIDYASTPEVEVTLEGPALKRAPARGTGRPRKRPTPRSPRMLKGRAFCPTCRAVVVIRRPLPNRAAHRWASLLTLGFWLVPWGIIEAGAQLQRWRCAQCGRRVNPARRA